MKNFKSSLLIGIVLIVISFSTLFVDIFLINLIGGILIVLGIWILISKLLNTMMKNNKNEINMYDISKNENYEDLNKKIYLLDAKLMATVGTNEEKLHAVEKLVEYDNSEGVPTLLQCISKDSDNEVILKEAIYGIKKHKDVIRKVPDYIDYLRDIQTRIPSINQDKELQDIVNTPYNTL